MAHSPHPFFRRPRKLWYVEIHKHQYLLGKHPEGAPPPKKNKKGLWTPPKPILEEFRRVMAEHYSQELPVKARPQPERPMVAEVLERFLAWCNEHRAAETYEWYRWRLQLFDQSLVDKSLLVTDLRHFHLDKLLADHPGWSSGMKHGACRALMRAFRWAKKKGHIDTNPLADYEKPRPGKRTVVIRPEQFEEIVSLAGSQNFKDLLEVTWETGCRPQESLAVEARHVDLPNQRWFFPPDEAKGEEWPRIVYLTETALVITRRLMDERPEGPLFRNRDGNPWTPFAVNCAFRRIQIRMGTRILKAEGLLPAPDKALTKWQRRQQLEKLATKEAPKYCLYHLRHSWLDRALKRGLDVLTCAILMGHRDPSTITKVYQHLSQSPEYLRDAARKAVG
jgi:integrase